MPGRTWDMDVRDTFNRRLNQYSEGLRGLPGGKPLIPTYRGHKTLMAEAEIKPGPYRALGSK